MYSPPPSQGQPPPNRSPLFPILLAVVAVALGALAVFLSVPRTETPSQNPAVQPVNREALSVVEGQLVFVPAYSEVFHSSENTTRALTVTLAIHNTDLTHNIVINSVRYYDTEGNLVQEYVETPLQIAPMATFGFVVDSADQRGGWGANFLVDWVSEQPVYEPIIEALMVSTQGVEGISFISPGRIISETP